MREEPRHYTPVAVFPADTDFRELERKADEYRKEHPESSLFSSSKDVKPRTYVPSAVLPAGTDLKELERKADEYRREHPESSLFNNINTKPNLLVRVLTKFRR